MTELNVRTPGATAAPVEGTLESRFPALVGDLAEVDPLEEDAHRTEETEVRADQTEAEDRIGQRRTDEVLDIVFEIGQGAAPVALIELDADVESFALLSLELRVRQAGDEEERATEITDQVAHRDLGLAVALRPADEGIDAAGSEDRDAEVAGPDVVLGLDASRTVDQAADARRCRRG